jgi:hypothetical protein
MSARARISGATTKRVASQDAVVRIPRLVLASKSVPLCNVTPCSNVLLPYSE